MKNIDEILDEVCWDNGYVNFERLQDSLRHPTSWAHRELKAIIEQTAKQYSREAEKYYMELTEGEGYEEQ